MSAVLGDRLQEAFDANLIQRCAFEEEPGGGYVQVLGDTTGLLAFWLAPGAELTLRELALRHYGGPATLEVWSAPALELGGVAAELRFPQLSPHEGAITIERADLRSTEATLHGVRAVRLLGVERWSDGPGS